jgi:hypothetical protein
MTLPSPGSSSELRRLQQFKSKPRRGSTPLGEAMVEFFKHTVARRQTKMAKLAEYWFQLVPETLSDHCALESFSRGTLTVLVDSSPHLYEIKQLLLSGLEKQFLIAAGKTGLRKISLRSGRMPEEKPSRRRAADDDDESGFLQ